VVDPVVVELGDVEDVIGGVRVCIDNRIRNDLLPDDRKERVFAASGIIMVWTLPPRLRMPKTGILPGCAAPAFALANAAKIALIDLDEPFDRQAILQLPSDNLTQPMKGRTLNSRGGKSQGQVNVNHTSGKVIGLRADMDALPIEEATGAP
jgi:hypothetical protein